MRAAIPFIKKYTVSTFLGAYSLPKVWLLGWSPPQFAHSVTVKIWGLEVTDLSFNSPTNYSCLIEPLTLHVPGPFTCHFPWVCVWKLSAWRVSVLCMWRQLSYICYFLPPKTYKSSCPLQAGTVLGLMLLVPELHSLKTEATHPLPPSSDLTWSIQEF